MTEVLPIVVAVARGAVVVALLMVGSAGGAIAQMDGGGGEMAGASGCGASPPMMATGGDGQPAPQVLDATVGQPFTVSLASNPTTGYRWGLAQPLDETIVQLVHSAYQRGQPGLIGAGGVETWTFLPLCVGATTIELEYRRPWEQPAPDDRHTTYVVVVQ